MLRRGFTLLVIPEEGGPTYEFRVARLYLWGVALIAAALVGLLALGWRAQQRADSLAQRVEWLERERAILAEEVASIGELEEILQGLKTRNDQLRMLTAEAFGLRGADAGGPAAAGQAPPERQAFIPLIHRLRYGNLTSVPTLKPVRTPVWSQTDPGVLLQAPGGALVRASAAGRVERTRFDHSSGWYEVSLDHGHGLITSYAGIGALSVETGDYVHKGQPLGLTARPPGAPPGLRFQVLEQGRDRTAACQQLWL